MEHLDDGTGVLTAYADPQFPGQTELFHAGANAQPLSFGPVGDIQDRIDWEIGGVSGEVDNFPWSLGVVSSDLVENFELDGRQAIIRRMDDNNYGPVGTSDHNMLLAMSYAQQINQFYPNEQSQYDLIRAV